MKAMITGEIEEFVKKYEMIEGITTKWGKPLVGFADAKHPLIMELPEIISSAHQLPKDVLPCASIVIAYFVPFTREMNRTNQVQNDIASREWALAYEETNGMFLKLNEHLIASLAGKGVRAAVSPETRTFDRETLISNWSHRHMARAAGLGSFGLNNMLITKQGCCGRFHSLVTNLDVVPDSPDAQEYCLYKKNGSCGICIKRCPAGALSVEGYDRKKCFAVLQKNAMIHTGLGDSYGEAQGELESDEHTESMAVQKSEENKQLGMSTAETKTKGGSDVCGKCIAFAPCAFFC
ncbi:epoxyqueuosine reductase [Anoxybacterium hadale]|uniref:Epoxyqueuosine reductase n=1 Tax=Anoxybacterium hadale TaxID=3408580 RepID=A0ACD1A7Q1_9FIRM|nr:epoxyqueuosine reductase [Clostridiales bacterium]